MFPCPEGVGAGSLENVGGGGGGGRLLRNSDATAGTSAGGAAEGKLSGTIRRFLSNLLTCSCLRRRWSSGAGGVGAGGSLSPGFVADADGLRETQIPTVKSVEVDATRRGGGEGLGGVVGGIDAGGLHGLGVGEEMVSGTRRGGIERGGETGLGGADSARRSWLTTRSCVLAKESLPRGIVLMTHGDPRNGAQARSREERSIGWTRFR